MRVKAALWALSSTVFLANPAQAQDLVGHSGPVGALAVAEGSLLSGGFDTRAILWSVDEARALYVSRFHDGTVTAVAHLGDGFVTAGQDGRIALWDRGRAEPRFATPRGTSPVASLDVAADGSRIAAGFFDGSVQILTLADKSITLVSAHSDRVTGVGFLPDGQIVSVGGDLKFLRWSPDGQVQASAGLPGLPNGLAISQNRAAIIFADGSLRVFSAEGAQLPERFLTDRPLVSVGAGKSHIVTGAIDGTVWTLAPKDLGITAMFRAADGPIWAVAADAAQVFTGSADGVVRRWDALTGASLGGDSPAAPEEYTDASRGAEIWRACAVCHSLVPDDHSRAGPSLHGVFGREIAAADGFDYSPALQALGIVWTPETVAELFEFGPEAYTPGSRMPEQRVADAQDRQALVDFIARATAHVDARSESRN
jgi:cytochrome c